MVPFANSGNIKRLLSKKTVQSETSMWLIPHEGGGYDRELSYSWRKNKPVFVLSS